MRPASYKTAEKSCLHCTFTRGSFDGQFFCMFGEVDSELPACKSFKEAKKRYDDREVFADGFCDEFVKGW